MLRSKVGYSINPDYIESGIEAAKKSTKDFKNVKFSFLYTSCNSNIQDIIKGIREVTDTPFIGCTSSGGIIVPDGYVTSENGFAGMLTLDDPNMTIGVGCHAAGRDARAIGRKVAIDAVVNAKSQRAPAYFYMVASPKNEEEYLMGIQDVIGRVPMFGGSAADDNLEDNWKIICNDKVISDGVAVAFFYTDNEIVTSYTGAYKETKNMGLITEVRNHRELISIDGISALKKYAHWTNVSPSTLKEKNLLMASVTKPIGIKDPLGNLTVIRHPVFANDNGTVKISDDTILLGNNVVEGTAVIQLESTPDQLIEGVINTFKDVKKQIYTDPAAFILIHDGARRIVLGDRIEEIAKKVVKESRGIPFIMPFTFGEYGYDEHSSNICGGLMLSFTAIGKN